MRIENAVEGQVHPLHHTQHSYIMARFVDLSWHSRGAGSGAELSVAGFRRPSLSVRRSRAPRRSRGAHRATYMYWLTSAPNSGLAAQPGALGRRAAKIRGSRGHVVGGRGLGALGSLVDARVRGACCSMWGIG